MSTHRALIAVVTPTKNRLRLLCEAIDSVKAQTFTAWEHIIVDDGSEDGTRAEVFRRAAADDRIRYVERVGGKAGPNACRNIGIRASAAELIVFLDSDDVLEPECLARRVAVMRRNADVDFATFQTGVFEQAPGDRRRQLDPELLGDDLLRFLFFEPPWIITAPVWRRTSLIALGMFDELLPSWQDIDLHVRALAAGCRYLRFAEVDHHVRWQFESTKVSVEQRRSAHHLKAATHLFAKFERVLTDGPGMNWVRQRALCSLYFAVAEFWVSAGNLSEALHCWSHIHRRRLGPVTLYLTGAALLVSQALGPGGRRIGNRAAHKWKGWMRMRTNPELVRR